MLLVVQADSPSRSAQRPRHRSVSWRACRCPVDALRVAQSHLHWRVVCGVSCLLCVVCDVLCLFHGSLVASAQWPAACLHVSMTLTLGRGT